MSVSAPSVAVVGHIEWVQFAHVDHVPRAGEVVHARDMFDEPAGGGGVAAVQLARLAGSAVLVTALGEDEYGRRSQERLRELGVDPHPAWRPAPTRRALTLVDDARERTITTFGARLEPKGAEVEEVLPGDAEVGGIYFTAGDEAALRASRAAARVLVASPRARAALGHGVRLDALVLSGEDPIELDEVANARAEADLLVLTEGERGGRYVERSGRSGRWTAVAPSAAPVDSYGCGDSFAAGLTFALAAGLDLDASLALAARCGAVCVTGNGPYERQLTARELKG
ncbi:MAG TPA: PfkB family carbohydrate kinase [Solirubrobacteraceae bacterium]